MQMNPTNPVQFRLQFDEPRRKPKNANGARRPGAEFPHVSGDQQAQIPRRIGLDCLGSSQSAGGSVMQTSPTDPVQLPLPFDEPRRNQFFQPTNLKGSLSHD